MKKDIRILERDRILKPNLMANLTIMRNTYLVNVEECLK